MKKSLLFWIHTELTHFCLSSELSKNFDADYNAIIDVPNASKIFF